MKKARPPYIDREIYDSFKINVKNEKEGRIRDTLKEELEKAILFYDTCGKDLRHMTKDEMIEYLDGVEWDLIVDVDGTKNLDFITGFRKRFDEAVEVRKEALSNFIKQYTGNKGVHSYRKYTQILMKERVISYNPSTKTYIINQIPVKDKFNQENDFKEVKKIEKAKQEVDEFFGGLYDI